MLEIEESEWWIVVAGKRRRTGYRCTAEAIRDHHPFAEPVEGTTQRLLFPGAKTLALPAVAAARPLDDRMTVAFRKRQPLARRHWKDEGL